MNSCKFMVSVAFMDHIELPAYIKNLEGTYMQCNQAFADCLGISKREVIGRTAYDIIPKELADVYSARDKKFFTQILHNENTSKSFDTESDGIFNRAIIYDDDSNIVGFLCIVNFNKISVTLRSSDDLKALTNREMEVLNELARGKSAKGIAKILNISSHTVTDHLKSIYRKLNVHSKNEALYKGLHLLMSYPKLDVELSANECEPE